MAWAKGETGNPNGRAHGTMVTDALKRAAIRLHDDPDNPNGKKKRALNIAASKVVSKAMQGDLACFQEVSNRLDGKVAQRIEGSLEVSPSAAHLEAIQELTAAIRGNQVDVTPAPEMIEHEPETDQ